MEASATPEMAVTEEQDTDNQVIGPELLQDQASDQESIHLSDSPRETVPSGRPVRNRRPPQVFTYSNLGSPAVNWYQANNITAYPNHGGTNFAQPYSNPLAPLYVGSPVSYPYHVGAVQVGHYGQHPFFPVYPYPFNGPVGQSVYNCVPQVDAQ